MKRVWMACALVALALLCAACGVSSTTGAQSVQGTSAAAKQPGPGGLVRDAEGLRKALQAAKVTISDGPQVTERFVTITGQTLFVNGERVEIFEYATPEAANAEAARIDPDACMVTTPNGTITLDWPDSPHFYKSGRLIVLYVGTTASMKQLLTSMLGGEFAGK
ncbi:MAG TPA: hypothetical protein VF510_13210 [Ktedonobacterales bacterium]